LAWRMIRNGESEIAVAEVDKQFALKLRAMPGLERTSPVGVRRFLVDRTNMLREPIPEYVDFTHRSFQEFLAAKGALDSRDIGLLIEHATDEQWRDTIILASGRADLVDRGEIIRRLIQLGDDDQQI